ncbi:hypothetical protein Hanom_Chr09g00820531 [Helianthus anomalus]
MNNISWYEKPDVTINTCLRLFLSYYFFLFCHMFTSYICVARHPYQQKES